MADFESIYAKNYNDGKVYGTGEWVAPEAGVTMRAGYRWSDSNWVLCLKITIPKPAKSLILSFCQSEGGPGGNAKANLRYKFTDAEDESLLNATSDIPGDGNFEVSLGDYVRNTITIKKMLAAGTHYMYIWTNDSSKTNNVLYTRWYTGDYGFYGSHDELEGASWIKDGGEVKPYRAAIQTGEGVKIHAPYVFEQGEWKALN